jgi:hypothetical protein
MTDGSEVYVSKSDQMKKLSAFSLMSFMTTRYKLVLFTAVITVFQCAREKSSGVNHLQWARHGDGSAVFSWII